MGGNGARWRGVEYKMEGMGSEQGCPLRETKTGRVRCACTSMGRGPTAVRYRTPTNVGSQASPSVERNPAPRNHRLSLLKETKTFAKTRRLPQSTAAIPRQIGCESQSDASKPGYITSTTTTSALRRRPWGFTRNVPPSGSKVCSERHLQFLTISTKRGRTRRGDEAQVEAKGGHDGIKGPHRTAGPPNCRGSNGATVFGDTRIWPSWGPVQPSVPGCLPCPATLQPGRPPPPPRLSPRCCPASRPNDTFCFQSWRSVWPSLHTIIKRNPGRHQRKTGHRAPTHRQ